LVRGALKAAHDPQKRPALICDAEQIDVRVELIASHRPHVLNALQAHQHPEGRLGQGSQVDLADAAAGERLHRPRALEALHGHERVENSQRQHALGHRRGELETNGPADVVDDEMEAVELKGVDGRRGESP